MVPVTESLLYGTSDRITPVWYVPVTESFLYGTSDRITPVWYQ